MSNAYRVLSDSRLRAIYDAESEEGVQRYRQEQDEREACAIKNYRASDSLEFPSIPDILNRIHKSVELAEIAQALENGDSELPEVSFECPSHIIRHMYSNSKVISHTNEKFEKHASDI